MVAITDKFNKTGDSSGSYPVIATVSSSRSAGEQVLACNSLAGWNTETPVHFTTYRVNSNGTVVASTQTDWKGIVVGNTITQLTRIAGAEDSGNLSGDKVELTPNIGWANDLMAGLLVSHNPDGTIKSGIIPTPTEGVVITVQTTDPGEGVSLAANHFIAVV